MYNTKYYFQKALYGIWTIAPEENCPPPVSVKVWVRFSFRVGGNFPPGQLSCNPLHIVLQNIVFFGSKHINFERNLLFNYSFLQRVVSDVFLLETNKFHKCIKIAKIINLQSFKFCFEAHTHKNVNKLYEKQNYLQ